VTYDPDVPIYGYADPAGPTFLGLGSWTLHVIDGDVDLTFPWWGHERLADRAAERRARWYAKDHPRPPRHVVLPSGAIVTGLPNPTAADVAALEEVAEAARRSWRAPRDGGYHPTRSVPEPTEPPRGPAGTSTWHRRGCAACPFLTGCTVCPHGDDAA
jgi:hypothetical protein